jgi:hypothetical protein
MSTICCLNIHAKTSQVGLGFDYAEMKQKVSHFQHVKRIPFYPLINDKTQRDERSDFSNFV